MRKIATAILPYVPLPFCVATAFDTQPKESVGSGRLKQLGATEQT